MLVLTRKLLEKIYVGNNVVIIVPDIDHGKIKLGIFAPKGVKVFREELLTEEQKDIELRATDGRGL